MPRPCPALEFVGSGITPAPAQKASTSFIAWSCTLKFRKSF